MFVFAKYSHGLSITNEGCVPEGRIALLLAPHAQAYDTAERLLLYPSPRILNSSDDSNGSWGSFQGKKHVDRSDRVYEARKSARDSITSRSLLKFHENTVCFASSVMLLSFAVIWLLFSRIHLCLGSSLPKVITQFAPPSVQQSWAAYTPYFSVKPYTPPPSNCHITQVRTYTSNFDGSANSLFRLPGQHCNYLI